MTSVPDPDLDRAAWSWTDHLRHGGSTPWSEWSAPADSAAEGRGHPPGAAQLEVVRRLAARHTAGAFDFSWLADLVLARSGPGRGLVEIPLAHPGAAPGVHLVGTPARDPSQIPVSELIRVCVGTLCDLVTSAPDDPPQPRQPRRLPWSKSFRLAGTPVSTALLRGALADAGHAEGGHRPTVIVVARQLEEMLCEVWTARTQRGVNMRWAKFVARWARQDRLPVSVDLPLVAAHWAERVGADRVHVIVPAHDHAAVRRTAGEILGVTAPPAAEPSAGDVLPVPPPGVDVLRRVNAVLNVRVEPERHRAALRVAARHLRGVDVPLSVPDGYTAWAHERSERLAEDLRAGGYAVHGDLQQVVSRRVDGADSVHRADVLDRALEACLRAAEQTGRGREVGS